MCEEQEDERFEAIIQRRPFKQYLSGLKSKKKDMVMNKG